MCVALIVGDRNIRVGVPLARKSTEPGSTYKVSKANAISLFMNPPGVR